MTDFACSVEVVSKLIESVWNNPITKTDNEVGVVLTKRILSEFKHEKKVIFHFLFYYDNEIIIEKIYDIIEEELITNLPSNLKTDRSFFAELYSLGKEFSENIQAEDKKNPGANFYSLAFLKADDSLKNDDFLLRYVLGNDRYGLLHYSIISDASFLRTVTLDPIEIQKTLLKLENKSLELAEKFLKKISSVSDFDSFKLENNNLEEVLKIYQNTDRAFQLKR